MEGLSEEQSAVIKKIANENGFQEYESIVKPGAERGDNFMGIITSVCITTNEKQLHLILKSALAIKHDNLYVQDVYKKEIFIYEEVFPEIEDVQKKFNAPHVFKAYPKIHASSVPNEFFIMEDIKSKGFKLWPKTLPMTPEHIMLVIKEYAKLHSLGMIMKEKRPDFFRKIDDTTRIPWSDEEMKKYDGFNKEMCSKLLRTVQNNQRAKDVVNTLLPKLTDYFILYERNSEYKMTIIHGDCWCNNMMFRYENGSDCPKEVCLLDWQISKIGSPAYDLTYFMFASIDIDELQNYESYLKVYHDVLSDNLKSAGLDPGKIFTLSSLHDHFRYFAVMGLISALFVNNITLGEIEETPNIEGGNMDGFLELFQKNISKQEEYDRRITERVLFISENDMLPLS